MLTNLLDRQSFPSVLEREIVERASASQPLSLLVVDVDRLTTLNARIGILAADGVLLELAKRLRGVTHRLDYAFRLGGGKFAVAPARARRPSMRASSSSRSARSSTGHPIGDVGVVSVSGGVAELVRATTPGRSSPGPSPRSRTQSARRGSVTLAGGDDEPPRAQELLHVVPLPGDRSSRDERSRRR